MSAAPAPGTAPDSAPASGSTRAAERSPLGTAALIAGVLLLLWVIFSTTLTAAMPYLITRVGMSVAAISLLHAAPTLVLGLLAVVLGAIALLQPGRRRTGAIIGTTIGASQLLILVLGTLGTVMFSAVLY